MLKNPIYVPITFGHFWSGANPFWSGLGLSEILRPLTPGIRTPMVQNTLGNFDFSEVMEAHKWPLRGHDPKLLPFIKFLTQKTYIWMLIKHDH